ncbi:MAG TPA: TIM-barrel domain-containing protein, partial [Gaiellaceae bacterium]|nr:TIM-barrel domain-containing protein [Gaiellaceae bacterium]
PLVYTDAAGAEHPLTRVVSSRLTPGSASVTLDAADTPATAQLTVGLAPGRVDVRVAVAPSAGAAALRVTLAAPLAAHFVGTGERSRFVDLRRTVQPLKVWNGCDSSAVAPFFASTSGFGAFLRTAAVGRIAFPGALDDTSFACDLSTPSCSVGPPAPAVRICVKSGVARLELYRGTPLQVVSTYVRRAGRPQAPWLPHFALMKWRDRIEGPQELLDGIHQLRSRGLPVGWVILDNPWGAGADEGCFGSLRFDPLRYPDPAGLIAQVHRLGVRFMLWISPQLKNKGCPPPPGYPNGWLTGDDEYYIRDLTLPDARADFVRRLAALAALGVDGFKADRGDEVDLEQTRLAGGRGAVFQNVYPRLYAQAVADAMRAYRSHWASLFRSASPGSAAAVPGFVGEDTTHTWDGLYGAVRMGQTASLAGEAMWGSDIGGYLGGELTPLLFVRWAQFAATTPIFEVGGNGASATFWQLGDTAVEGFRAAATLHYELVPYLYELVREASVSGTPVLRPLGLDDPDDASAWRSDTEYTVGDALLAAPVVTAKAGPVYLPSGTWVDYWTGERVQGGRAVSRRRRTDELPLYVRAGSAFADNFRTPSLWSSPWRPDDLARAGRQGWVVAADRGATAVARSGSTTLRATVSTGGDVRISLRGAEHDQQLRVHVPGRICSVDGLPHARTVASLARAAGGWLRDPSRRGTVVVKAHVTRTATIELRACQ